jgi:hypothetical protein
MVQARLDEETDSLRAQLQQQLGWSNSKIVREGIKAISHLVPRKGKRKIAGLGKYDTGISDLSTNREHMKGFGE